MEIGAFDSRIEEIFVHVTPGDRIRYVANELDKPVSCSLKDFTKLLIESKVDIKNRYEFKKSLDSFNIIKLYLKTGLWENVDLDKDKGKEDLKNELPRTNLKKEVMEKIRKEKKDDLNNRLKKVVDGVRDLKITFMKKKGLKGNRDGK